MISDIHRAILHDEISELCRFIHMHKFGAELYTATFIEQLIAANKYEVLATLINFRPNCIKQPSEYYGTLLHAAIRNNKPQIVNLFLISGIDHNIQDTSGRTPYMQAIIENNFAIASNLFKFGINYGKRDVQGNTALLYTVSSRYLDMIVWMLEENRSELNMCNDNNENVLTQCVVYNLPLAVYDTFIWMGVKPQITNCGHTLLDIAQCNDRPIYITHLSK